MSETKEKTRKQLRLILSIAFSLDAAMEELVNGITMEDDEGDTVLRDERDLEAWRAVSGFRHRLGELTCDLHRVILNRYECRLEDKDGQ